MGENAKVSWEWHNNEVGRGYKARGVVRQSSTITMSKEKIIDMTRNYTVTDSVGIRDEKYHSDRGSDYKNQKTVHYDEINVPAVIKRKTEHGTKDRCMRNGAQEYRFNPLMHEFALSLNDVCSRDT